MDTDIATSAMITIAGSILKIQLIVASFYR